jgi:hypothetical protein
LPEPTTKIVLTYEDFVALPDDGKRYELHEGELSVTPARARGTRPFFSILRSSSHHT